MGFLLLLLVVVTSAAYSGAVASSKGHSGMSWTFGGLLFGPLALVAAAGLPDLKARNYLRDLAGEQEAPSKTRSGPGIPGPGFWD